MVKIGVLSGLHPKSDRNPAKQLRFGEEEQSGLCSDVSCGAKKDTAPGLCPNQNPVTFEV